MSTVKRASIYKRKSAVFVHAQSQTTAGVWIFARPCVVLSIDDKEAVGRAIRSALEGSEINVPHPSPSTRLGGPLYDMAGVKGWAAFAKGAAAVEVEEHGSLLAVIPMKNLGPQKGFVPDTPGQVVLEGSDPGLGAVVLEILGVP